MAHVTRTPLWTSKGQRSTSQGGSGILWRPPAYRLFITAGCTVNKKSFSPKPNSIISTVL